MSSPISDLSWPSGDELLQLEIAFQAESASGLWQSKWTPINPSSKQASSDSHPAPLSPRSSAATEAESSQASKFRTAILGSAERMRQIPKGTKRTASASSPGHARNKRSMKASDSGITKKPASKSKIRERAKQPLDHSPSQGPRTTQRMPAPIDIPLTPTSFSRLNVQRPVGKGNFAHAFPKTSKESQLDTCAGSSDPKDEVEHQGSIAQENNSDFLDDDDDFDMLDILEAEKVVITGGRPATRSGDPTEMPTFTPESPPPFGHSNSTTPCTHSSQPATPMQPFMRSFRALQSPSKTSEAEVTGFLSPQQRISTCFRIAEILRHLSGFKDDSKNSFLTFEVYATAHSSCEAENPSTVKLADLFFPNRPPYLLALLSSAAENKRQRGSPKFAFQRKNVPPVLVRAILEASPRKRTAKGPAPEIGVPSIAARFEIKLLKIQTTSWDEVRRVRNIVEPDMCTPSWTNVEDMDGDGLQVLI